MSRFTLPVLFLVACQANDDVVFGDLEPWEDTASEGMDPSEQGEATEPFEEPEPQLPSVRDVDAWCYQHTTGDHDFVWMVTAIADDPQGTDTLAPMVDGIEVIGDNGEHQIYTVVCTPEGDCFGSWLESDDGVSCTDAGSYTVHLAVMDEDGNWSATQDVRGRVE